MMGNVSPSQKVPPQAGSPRGPWPTWQSIFVLDTVFYLLFQSPFPSLLFGVPYKLFTYGMVDFICHLGWATMPRYVVKHYSGYFSDGVFG